MIFEEDQKFASSKESHGSLDAQKKILKYTEECVQFEFLTPWAVPLVLRKPAVLSRREGRVATNTPCHLKFRPTASPSSCTKVDEPI